MTRILLAGATGLIGRQVVELLADMSSDHELHIISRRPVGNLPVNITQHIDDASRWSDYITASAPDVLISCLGTTIKTAGSKSAFAAVDLNLVSMVGQTAKTAGAGQMIMVSSVGANVSSANFYLSTKGKAEQALRAIGFDRLDIIRPGLLRGNRAETRTGELLGMMLSPLTDAMMHGRLRRYRSIDSATVAKAITNLTMADGSGMFIHENDAITTLAG
jgi:uncharacterized protein YbjT (DUF2867 family)